MVLILTVAVRESMPVCIQNFKKWNINVQQDYLSKKEQIWLLNEVSFTLFLFGKKTSGFYLCFIISEYSKICLAVTLSI